MVNPVNANLETAVPTIGPRAKAFKEESDKALNTILNNIVQVITTDSALSPKDFFDKHVTAKGKADLSALDKRTNILMYNILCDSLVAFARAGPVFVGLIGKMRALSAEAGDSTLFGQMVREKAYPVIQDTIARLDAAFPGVVDEAVADGITALAQQVLPFFNVDYPLELRAQELQEPSSTTAL